MKEFEFYHGAILTALIHKSTGPLTISLFPTTSNASYVFNDEIGLYIKHSSKRMSPWIFTMKPIHIREINEMKNSLSRLYLILICGHDGAVTLNEEETFALISKAGDRTEWISASRSPRSEYTVKGSQGILKYKVGKNELFKKVLDRS